MTIQQGQASCKPHRIGNKKCRACELYADMHHGVREQIDNIPE